jgi:hypothetical protein
MNMNYEENIEELFATFEMMRILDGDRFLPFQAEKLSDSMKKVISATIENRMPFSIETVEGLGTKTPPSLRVHELYRPVV